MEKFGKTFLLVLFVLMFVVGAKMALRVADPYTRKLSPSLADAFASV